MGNGRDRLETSRDGSLRFIFILLCCGWVNPDRRRESRMRRRTVHEPCGIRLVGRVEPGLPLADGLVCPAVMHRRRSEQRQSSVVMLAVVPVQQLAAQRPRILDGAEALWE